jgi:GMP synthase (glutamine-hydrolysing)
MKLLIVDNAELEDKKYNEPLVGAVSRLADFEIINYKKLPPEEIIASKYNGIILSGVPLHYSFESIELRLLYINWILNTRIPVLGICLGHESIGSLFGATVIHNEEAESGTCELRIINDDPIFQNIQPEFKILTHHRGSITLPKDFAVLASSKKCKNQIMKHNKRNIYGFQFHPELSDIGEILLNNFINISSFRTFESQDEAILEELKVEA